jgi:orotate phosphoribosyltransferase
MDFESILKQYGVLKEGHFKLTSGLHSGQYFEKFRILEHPELVTQFAQAIVDFYCRDGITLVCGPTTGGVIIAFEVARQLKTRCVVAEKAEPSGRKVGRGFQIGPKDRILVVDDVLTTGGSVNDTLAALKPFGATIAGIAVFIDRSAGGESAADTEHLTPNTLFPIRHFAVYQKPVQNYPPDNCPLCRAGIPLIVPGSTGKK